MPQVYPMIFRMVDDAGMAEDILQDTFLSVWTHRARLPGIENPRSWLLRIAYYKSLTALRNMKTQRKAAAAISATSAGSSRGSFKLQQFVALR